MLFGKSVIEEVAVELSPEDLKGYLKIHKLKLQRKLNDFKLSQTAQGRTCYTVQKIVEAFIKKEKEGVKQGKVAEEDLSSYNKLKETVFEPNMFAAIEKDSKNSIQEELERVEKLISNLS